jgi:polysaccharide deacetylase family protein (PEP-CTERM system associated)
VNILTFDIEDWYNVDFITQDFNWDKYEVRIYEGVDRILERLEKDSIKGTFFCLGWLAEKHPSIIRRISEMGHHIGCHSYQHQLSFRFTSKEFRDDTNKAKILIEDVIGYEVDAFRAPGFSITKNNLWALDILVELGFKYDCSIFPANHDYGGFPSFGQAEPVLLLLANGATLKEFPINMIKFMGKDLVFSGGGFFRLFPYALIKKWSQQSPYLMTYFHTRDFDPGQPMIESLPLMRKFKSYVGLNKAFSKFQKYLNDFEFFNIQQADGMIDWGTKRVVKV